MNSKFRSFEYSFDDLKKALGISKNSREDLEIALPEPLVTFLTMDDEAYDLLRARVRHEFSGLINPSPHRAWLNGRNENDWIARQKNNRFEEEQVDDLVILKFSLAALPIDGLRHVSANAKSSMVRDLFLRALPR